MTKPDFTKGDKIPDKAEHDWNLGATGARGWIYSHKLTTSDARQIKITSIAKGSPAEKVLEVDDVILGVGKTPFESDPRTAFGKALTVAEATIGKLSLLRWRDGKTELVTLQLPVLGNYSTTAPYQCSKSQKIVKLGCEAIAKSIQQGVKHRHPITRSLNALALLASGDAKYMPEIKKEAEWAAQFTSNGYKSWSYSYVIIFLSEYTISSGDKSLLPGLRRLTMEVVNGQSEVGSWGHRFVGQDGRLSGYGMMNSPGIPLTIGLVLAREAGVKGAVVNEAIEKSTKLLRFYSGKGAIPYGDHHPWIQTHDDNGKCGMAAVLFTLLGEKDTATYFSKMSLAAHGSERDTGHTGNFFNVLWALPGVAQSGPEATGAWMQEYGAWYFDLARQWNGSFIHQGPPNMKKDSYRNWDCTGAYLLSYAMPLKKLHLTRKTGSTVDRINKNQAKTIVDDGKGWTNKDRYNYYNSLNTEEIIKRLSNWSPVVRERAAIALKKKKLDKKEISKVIGLLKSDQLYTRIGACQALAYLKYPVTVPALTDCLDSDDLWLRVKAAETLASMGEPAMPALPKLLEMLAKGPTKADPRGMEQRYLNYAIFNKMLKKSLDGVDRTLLQKAIVQGLKNEDGRSRGSIGRVYQKLTYDEIKPLLPAIHEAIKTPAPSGIMFSSEVRLAGVELLAKHRIKEGMSLCLDIMEIDKWGKQKRIKRCLNALSQYGSAATPLLRRLVDLEQKLSKHREAKKLTSEINMIKTIIYKIKTKSEHVPLKSIK